MGYKLWKEGANVSPSFQLSNDEVQVWSTSLEQPSKDLARFFTLLSADEKERSKRFYFERDQNHFIVGRGILRVLLGNYLGIEPARIEFSYGAHGKPELGTAFHRENLQFNLSHSKDKALYAFNWDQPVGIDIEHVRPMKDMDDFAFQFFTPTECRFIQSLPNNQKQEFFFKLWTCKEAFLKANGSGLTVPINQVEVSLAPGGTASLTFIGADTEQATDWRLELFIPIKGCQASVAIKGYKKRIIFQEFNPL